GLVRMRPWFTRKVRLMTTGSRCSREERILIPKSSRPAADRQGCGSGLGDQFAERIVGHLARVLLPINDKAWSRVDLPAVLVVFLLLQDPVAQVVVGDRLIECRTA